MKLRTLGKTGYRVSEIGLGCWQLGGDFGEVAGQVVQSILSEADKQGINLWDTADVYGGGLSEERIGEWLRAHPADRIVITKVGRDAALYPDGYTRNKVRANIEGSLRRLGVEALDLVQLHCVPQQVLQTGDLLNWLSDLQKDGLIKHFGASVETIEEALLCLGYEGIASLQLIFNLFRQDAIESLLPKAAQANVGIIVRLPLASGVLSGSMSKDRRFSAQDHRNYNADGAAFSVGETFSGIPFATAVDLAEGMKELLPADLSLGQAALRWILDQPAVSTVIAGCSKREQVARSAAASALTPLPRELHARLERYYQEKVRAHIRCPI
jgi:aryl-alcohol dehydrogenase-like predicted oxidoreductase